MREDGPARRYTDCLPTYASTDGRRPDGDGFGVDRLRCARTVQPDAIPPAPPAGFPSRRRRGAAVCMGLRSSIRPAMASQHHRPAPPAGFPSRRRRGAAVCMGLRSSIRPAMASQQSVDSSRPPNDPGQVLDRGPNPVKVSSATWPGLARTSVDSSRPPNDPGQVLDRGPNPVKVSSATWPGLAAFGIPDCFFPRAKCPGTPAVFCPGFAPRLAAHYPPAFGIPDCFFPRAKCPGTPAVFCPGFAPRLAAH